MKTITLLMQKAKKQVVRVSTLTLTLLLSYSLTVLNIQAQTWPPTGMQGNGSESSPWQITTPEHLEALALYVNAGNGNETNGVYYKMMNNIDLIGYAQGEGWMPIGRSISGSDYSKAFQGNFNGNGNMVLNLILNRPTENHIGLFGLTYNSKIHNIGVHHCDIFARGWVGGLVGSCRYSDIDNCYVSGKIQGTPEYIGGLVGMQVNNSIKNCYASCNVVGYGLVGGLVGGSINEVLVSNCYTEGSVEGNQTIGGLAGSYTNLGEIRNCFVNNDSVILYTSSTAIGRITSSSSTILKNNYAYKDMVVQNTIGDITITDGLNTQDGKGVDMELLQSFDFYATASYWYNNEAWDIASASLGNPNSVWKICDGEGLPFLRWQKKGCDIFTITATAGSNGTINPLGEVLVNELEDQTFTFSAHSGYHVDSLFIDGVYKPEYISAGKYIFEEVVADHTIHVTFAAGVGVASTTLSNLQVYPNPTQNKFILDFDGEATIVIYDFFGKELSSQKFNCKTETNISHLPNGVYTIQVFSEGKMIGSSKIIKK